MSKPLIFILQLVGAGMMLFSGGDVGLIVIGGVLVVIGGIGFRARVKSNKPESMSELVSVLKEQNEMLKKKLNEK